MAAAAGKKESVSAVRGGDQYGGRGDLSTMATLAWAEGVWMNRW